MKLALVHYFSIHYCSIPRPFSQVRQCFGQVANAGFFGPSPKPCWPFS